MADATPRTRKFLGYIDETPECRLALRFASRQAKYTGGGVTLLRVTAPADVVADVAREAREAVAGHRGTTRID